METWAFTSEWREWRCFLQHNLKSTTGATKESSSHVWSSLALSKWISQYFFSLTLELIKEPQ